MENEKCLSCRSLFTSAHFSCFILLYLWSNLFQCFEWRKSWCRPCGTLRIVFRNVPAPDLGGQAKLSANTAKETDTNTSLTILIIAWKNFNIYHSRLGNFSSGLSFSLFSFSLFSWAKCITQEPFHMGSNISDMKSRVFSCQHLCKVLLVWRCNMEIIRFNGIALSWKCACLVFSKVCTHRISCCERREVDCEMEVRWRWNGNHERNGSEYRPHQASDVHFPHNSIEIAWIK